MVVLWVSQGEFFNVFKCLMSEHLTQDAVMGHLPSVGPTDCNLSLTQAGFTTPFCCPGAWCGASGEEAETVLRAARWRSGRLLDKLGVSFSSSFIL